MEATHLEGTGSDHMAVGVEIEQANTTGHNHAMKEVQYLRISNPNAKFEVSRLTVDNPDSSCTYKINFQSPAMKYVASNEISCDASASTVRSGIRNYYRYTTGIRSDVSVNKTMYDVNGTVTTSSSLAKKHVFHIKLYELISGVSTA